MKDDLLIVDAFASEFITDAIMTAFDRCRFKYTHFDSDGTFFDHRVMWASAYPEDEVTARFYLMLLAALSTDAVREFFVEPAVYCDGIQTVIWPEGVAMPPHQDDRHPNPAEPHNTPWRFIASVVYLNDNYSGGEIYFPDRDQVIKPKRGQLIAFPGAWWHGVHAVTGGQRFTCPSWYSRSPEHEDVFLQ